MASLCRQIIRGNALKGVLLNSARRGYADKMMADPLEHATGLEKKELLAIQSGDDDPFNMKVLKKAAGTKANPTLVPSCFDARIVGCICEEHSTAISWLWIHKGQPRRCECGHWYKLIEKTPL
ncbi:cytochrome c oxidase subunit 5B, mitochondrial-like [Cydia strobilella]|uniref:cytochrome c oxidase subunit 5B, mitochondrial-like n=1 Tax=Leguminivora glycinivorella TaxID=1035111 RepID=UPI00200BDDEF|nr:cytochrome c oxidase subunit 5B, mitochondrial-like [Leguminivora glycinivorella]XP_061723766.1 cytochrome c oxidase subunit 5B, mitochondrial-like [Cydia pomonella]